MNSFKNISILQAVCRQYRKKRMHVVLEQYSALEFENDEISLDIINSSGWEILALSEPLSVSNHWYYYNITLWLL